MTIIKSKGLGNLGKNGIGRHKVSFLDFTSQILRIIPPGVSTAANQFTPEKLQAPLLYKVGNSNITVH
jgi:hypothetical protein